MIERHFGVGGWSVVGEAESYLVYGEVYKNTVKALLEQFNKIPSTTNLTELLHKYSGAANLSEFLDDTGTEALKNHVFGILPIVFLFRHYIELKLKGLILLKREREGFWGLHLVKLNTHNIEVLLKQLKGISGTSSIFGINVICRISSETENFINELQKWDKGADGFRYPYNIKGGKFFQGESIIPPEFLRTINTFSSLKDIILKVMKDLENIEGDFEQEKENRENQADIA